VPVHEELIQANRERVHDPELRPLLQIRRQRGEGPFGYFKQFGGLRRFAGRGLDYASKKTLIAAVGWNLLCLLRRAAEMDAVAPLAGALATCLFALLGLWNRLSRLRRRIGGAMRELRGWLPGRTRAALATSRTIQIAPLSACC
jgi:hypothetical protein